MNRRKVNSKIVKAMQMLDASLRQKSKEPERIVAGIVLAKMYLNEAVEATKPKEK